MNIKTIYGIVAVVIIAAIVVIIMMKDTDQKKQDRPQISLPAILRSMA